jgi:hypothetical protein
MALPRNEWKVKKREFPKEATIIINPVLIIKLY